MTEHPLVDLRRVEPGDSFRAPPLTLTSAMVEAWAALTGDHHPVHLDAEFAARSVFGTRVVHGLLVLSSVVGHVNIDPRTLHALVGIDRVRFKEPVPVDSTVEGVFTVRTVTRHGEVALVTVEVAVFADRPDPAVAGRVRLLSSR